MGSGNSPTKMLSKLYSVYLYLHLQVFDQKVLEYCFGVISDDIVKFCIPIPVPAMTSSIMYVLKR